MLKKLVKYLSSLRFTLLLISLLGFMFLLGLWIPQTSIVSGQMYALWKQKSPALVGALEALGFTSIYASPIMLTLWGFFFVNLGLVMWQRVPLIRKRIALPQVTSADPATAPGYSFRASYPLPEGLGLAEVMEGLRKRGFAVVGSGNAFTAVKNRLSPIAFGLFHLSFFLILLGGLISVYTRFIGEVDLGIGESFHGEIERYIPTPQMPKIGVPPRVSFTVLDIKPQMVQGTKTGLKVRLVDARGIEHEADVNKPYKVDHTNFIVSSLGVAPLFVVRDAQGKEIDGAYFKLNVLGGKEDVFSLAGYHFRARFFPDYFLDKGVPSSRSIEFKNPVFVITVERQGKQITQGTMAEGGSVAFDGHELLLKELPYSVRLAAFKEHGVWIIYLGFAIASLAVVWRFLFYRREIIGILRDDTDTSLLEVAGKSEFYKSLSEDDFSAIFSRITGIDPDARGSGEPT